MNLVFRHKLIDFKTHFLVWLISSTVLCTELLINHLRVILYNFVCSG